MTESPLVITRWQAMSMDRKMDTRWQAVDETMDLQGNHTEHGQWQSMTLPVHKVNFTKSTFPRGLSVYDSIKDDASNTQVHNNVDENQSVIAKENRMDSANVNQYLSKESNTSAIRDKKWIFSTLFPSSSTLSNQSAISTQSPSMNSTTMPVYVHDVGYQSAISEMATQSNNTAMPVYVGYLLAITAGACSPFAVIMTRGTSIKNEPIEIQVIWIWISGLVISTVAMVIFQHPIMPQTLRDWLLLLGHVTFSFLGTVTYYLAINLTSGVLVNITNTTSVIISLFAQYFILHGLRPGHQNILEVLGSVLVFIAACLNSFVQLVKEKCKHQPKE